MMSKLSIEQCLTFNDDKFLSGIHHDVYFKKYQNNEPEIYGVLA